MTTAVTTSLFQPYPKQRLALALVLDQDVEQLLFGGSAGGGKSAVMRMLAASLAVKWPGSVVAIFRRTDMELQANHVSKWLVEVDPFVPAGRFFQQKMEYHWPSPPWCWCQKDAPCAHSSVTAFRHVDDNRGVLKYQGPEFAAELVDEATHFKGSDIDFLYTRIRAPEGAQYPQEVIGPDGRTYHYPGWPGYRPLQVLTANPGGIGHNYMRDNYIDPLEGLERLRVEADPGVAIPQSIHSVDPIVHPVLGTSVWEESVTVRGEKQWVKVDMRDGQQWTVDIDLGEMGATSVRRAFVPSRLWDNPALDPVKYAATLAVGSAETRKRMLDGDWGYSEDRVFKVLDKAVHLVEHHRVFLPLSDGGIGPAPHSWVRGIGLDHGSAKPTAVEWLAFDPDGYYVFYAEHYRPGSVQAQVTAIREVMEWDGHMELRPQADPQMWRLNQSSRDEVVSVAALYAFAGEIPSDPVAAREAQARGIQLAQSKITDIAALLALEEMLEPSPERLFPPWHPRAGQYGSPQLFFTTNVPNLWRELTALRHPKQDGDGFYGEGIKNGQADHAFDACKRIAGPLRSAIAAGAGSSPRSRVRTTFSYAAPLGVVRR